MTPGFLDGSMRPPVLARHLGLMRSTPWPCPRACRRELRTGLTMRNSPTAGWPLNPRKNTRTPKKALGSMPQKHTPRGFGGVPAEPKRNTPKNWFVLSQKGWGSLETTGYDLCPFLWTGFGLLCLKERRVGHGPASLSGASGPGV